MIKPTDRPVFVPKYHPASGGTDFLGLRVVNVSLMDECLPGINNASRYIRPFSLIAWMYWKFHKLASAKKNLHPTSAELSEWKEKIEILFTYGHVLEGIRGIPGIDATPPSQSRIPLDFESWHRNPTSTSLMAAVQYGPPAKSPSGLSFIEPTESGLFRTVGNGVKLAEALDEVIVAFGKKTLTESLRTATATETEIRDLLPAWSIINPSSKEKRAFRESFFPDESALDARSAKRKATLTLILQVLAATKTSLSTEQVREDLFHGTVREGNPCSVHGSLQDAWLMWVCLQIRQAHRLAMEYLLAWVEERLIADECRDTEAMVKRILQVWSGNQAVLCNKDDIGTLCSTLFPDGGSVTALVQRSYADEDQSIFRLMECIQTGKSEDERLMYALRTLFFCAEYAERLWTFDALKSSLQLGGPERISLKYWRDHVRKNAKSKLKDFLIILLEQHVISQHLSVAARRYDGGTQRLRISIEEEGLKPLITSPLPLNVTSDRLYYALSLMADCEMIRSNGDDTFSSLGFARAAKASD